MSTMINSEFTKNAGKSLKKQSSQSISSQQSAPSSQREFCQETDESDVEDLSTSGTTTHSRKEKSLGILCQRFLVTMGDSTRDNREIHLESVAKHMNTEKRRIYDIVNVMEALEAMNKTNKSYYRWNKLSKLPELMNKLKKEAEIDDLPRRIKNVEAKMCSFTELGGGNRETVGSVMDESNGSLTNSPVDGRSTDELRQTKSNTMNNSLRDRNGKNSLAQLCRRFLMVLLCNPDDKRKVSLDVASTVLIKEPESEGYDPPSRSRCRRLYDIANVLVAMGLIKKVHYLFGTKKIPLFVYCGPEPSETRDGALKSMLEFVKRSELAKPDDSTWIAIFGNPIQTEFTAPILNSLQNRENRPNSQSSMVQSKPASVNSLLQSKKPVGLMSLTKTSIHRKVFGELDPINPRSSDPNSNSHSSSISLDIGNSKKSIKRTHDENLKSKSKFTINKENNPPLTQINDENDENSLPKPKPRVPLASNDYENQTPSEYEPPSKRQSNSTDGLFASRPPLLPHFTNLSACLPNISSYFNNINAGSNNNNMQYLAAAALQMEHLRKMFSASQNQQSNSLDVGSYGTAFKPFHPNP